MKLVYTGLSLIPLIFLCLSKLIPNQSSIVQFSQAVAWGVIVFQAMYAFGKIFMPLFLGKSQAFRLFPSIGLAFTLFLFGWLNLFALISREWISILIAFGVFIFSGMMWSAGAEESRFSAHKWIANRVEGLLIILTILSVICGYVLAIAKIEFNMHDDYHAYLFFPKKILDLGLLGPEPLSERRLISGLAGNSALLAIGLANMQWYFLHAIDWGLGILIMSYLIYSFRDANHDLASLFVAASLIFGICFFSNPSVNISSNVMPMTIIFSIWTWIFYKFRSENTAGDISFGDGIFIGVMIGALLSLKSTLIPYIAVSLVLICTYILSFMQFSKAKFFKFILGILITLAIYVLAWSIDLYLSSGTFLYPLLGKGFHAIQYGYFESATSQFFSGGRKLEDLSVLLAPLSKSVYLLSIALLIIYGYQIYKIRNNIQNLILAILPLCASIINCIIVGYAIGGYGAYRYVYFPALVSLIVSMLIAFEACGPKAKIIRIGIYSVCIFFLVRGVQDQYINFNNAPLRLDINSAIEKLDLLKEKENYLELSNAIPSDALALIRVSYPFLLTNKPNFFIADYPGAASPPPGIPINDGPEAMREYLLSQGIKYLVWDYKLQANFSKNDYGDRLGSATHPWIRSEATLSFQFQDNLEKMRLNSNVIYDSGGIAIIDLKQ